MEYLQILTFLMTIAIVLVGVGSKLHIPYPIVLIMGGSILGFIPALGDLKFDPNLILSLVLPPILFYAAYSIPFKEFSKNIYVILWLGLGLVFVTTIGIGVILKWLIPDIPWALAFTFGAVISPPDAAAATTLLKRLNISPRLRTILEGESLINDAAGLVLYKFAVIALMTGTFSIASAGVDFVEVVTGGILVGILCGYALNYFSSYFLDSVLAVVYSFAIPYITFFAANYLEVSGVIAVVVCGLIGSRILLSHFSALTRVLAWASWDIAIIICNCFVFILIGLQLQDVVSSLTVHKALTYFGYGILLTVAMIAIRFMFIYSAKYIRIVLNKKYHRVRLHKPGETLLLSWSNMRGIVSLTAALGLPYAMPDGTPLQGRDIFIFMTFVVIFLSLLLPGLTFSSLISWLKIQPSLDEDTNKVRSELVNAAHEEIQRHYTSKKINTQEFTLLSDYFSLRHKIKEMACSTECRANTLEHVRKQAYQNKRKKLLELWEKDRISDYLFNTIEHELDLEESNIARGEI